MKSHACVNATFRLQSFIVVLTIRNVLFYARRLIQWSNINKVRGAPGISSLSLEI